MTVRKLQIALLAVGLIAPAAHGFWSLVIAESVRYSQHNQITKEALGVAQYSWSAANVSSLLPPYSFSERAIAAINRAHQSADEGENYRPADHFDRAMMRSGFEQLREGRRSLTAQQQLLSTADITTVDQEIAWSVLGYMLHAVQDFYSHSTWAESNLDPDQIVDFGKYSNPDSSKNLPLPPYLLQDTPGGSLCDDTGFSLSGPQSEANLTTGHYDTTVDPEPTIPAGACRHGELSDIVLAHIFKTKPKGIAKDAPDASYREHGSVRMHYIARRQATRESIALVRSIIADLFASGNSVGFCALLDISMADPVCQPPIQVYRVAAGGSYPGVSNNVSPGVLNTPIPVEVRTTRTLTDSRSTGGPSVSSSSSTVVQGAYLFEDGSPLRVYVPRSICRIGSNWIPRTYRWSAEQFTANSGTGYEEGSGSGYEWSGDLALDAMGNLVVNYYRRVYGSTAYSEPVYARYRQIGSHDIRDHTIYRSNLENGAGSWVTNTDGLSEFRQTSPMPEIFPVYQYTTIDRAEGQVSWPAEQLNPPTLLGVYLSLSRVLPLGSSIPPECTSQTP